MLLLHIDALSLLGESAAAQSLRALAFAEQLLGALMVQLQSPPQFLPAPADPTDWPPIAPVLLPAGSSLPLPAVSLPQPSLPAPMQSAAAALLSARHQCGELMWGIISDSDNGEGVGEPRLGFGSPASAASATLASHSSSSSLLHADVLRCVRPVQSFRVQEGCVSRAADSSFRSADAFLYHAESTRIATDTAAVAANHGSLHVSHFLRELLFKLGLGSKYGA